MAVDKTNKAKLKDKFLSSKKTSKVKKSAPEGGIKKNIAVKTAIKKLKSKKSKKAKPQSNQEKKNNSAKERKVITETADPDALNWNPVEVNRRVDDFEGFFGLEELEGVTVEKADSGDVKFVQKEVKNKPKEKRKRPSEESEAQKRQEAWLENPLIDQDNIEDLKESDKEEEEDSKFEDSKEGDNESSIPKKRKIEPKGPAIVEIPKQLKEIDTSVLEWPEMEKETLSIYAKRALVSLNFLKPTEIQAKAIPEILAGNDVIGKAATGSGKTLAYGLPILEKHLELVLKSRPFAEQVAVEEKKWPTGLIFSPTRELAVQIQKHLKAVSHYYPFEISTSNTKETKEGDEPKSEDNAAFFSTVMSVTGGLSLQKQQRLLKSHPSIVVATPGRFLELLESDDAWIEMFQKTEIVVLDEADRMLQEGHFQEMQKILDLLTVRDVKITTSVIEKAPKSDDEAQETKQIVKKKKKFGQVKRQTLVFSATFQQEFMHKLSSNKGKGGNSFVNTGRLSTNEEAMSFLQKKIRFRQQKPKFIDANPAENVAKSIYEAIIECDKMEKDLYLYYFTLLYPGRTLVFVNSIDAVKRITPLLKELYCPPTTQQNSDERRSNVVVVGLHSHMIQKQRLRSIERFTSPNSKNAIMVATDVAARGLDIPLVQHVVHYNLPRTADMYVHRAGRTARAGEQGVSVILCAPEEASGPLAKLKRMLYNTPASKKEKSVTIEEDEEDKEGEKKKQQALRPKRPGLKYFDVEHDVITRIKPRVTLAKKISDSVLQSTYKGKDESWIREAADDLGVDLDDNEFASIFKNSKRPNLNANSKQPQSNKDDEKILTKDELAYLRRQLKELLDQPVMMKKTSAKYLTSGSVNLAQLVISGGSHETVIGKEKQTAIENITTKKKK